MSTRSLNCGKTLGKVSEKWENRGSRLTDRAAKYQADQFGAKINAVQKEIGQLKKVRPSLFYEDSS